MKYSELKNEMREFNRKHGIERAAMLKQNADGKLIHMKGYVVIKEEALNSGILPYTKEERTYTFSNYNKALTSGDGGYSIFAHNDADGDNARIENLQDSAVEEAGIIETVE